MILLDASAIIHILRGTKQGVFLKEKLENIPVGVSSITRFEVLRGARAYEQETTKAFLASMEQVYFDDVIAQESVQLDRILEAKGAHLSMLDLFTAATCLSRKCSLATTNADFERVPELSLVLT